MLYRELLQEKRHQPDMTLRRLARDIDIPLSLLHRYLNRETLPQGPSLTKLARYFNRSERELVAGHEVYEELKSMIRAMSPAEQVALRDMLKQSQFLRERQNNVA